MKRPFKFIIILTILSCSENDINAESDIFNEINAVLPTDIILKEIPAGTFTMGGATIQNDAPEVIITLTAFKMSEKEITNKNYMDFLNSAYINGWINVYAKLITDPCGTYTEKMIIGAGNAPNAGEVFLQLGETGGCTSKGEPEHINNKSWITYNSSNQNFELIDSTKADWPVNWVKWYGAYAFAKYYDVNLPTEAQWEYASRGGQQLNYPTDDGTLDLTKANYNGDKPGIHNPNGHPVAVASYPKNPFGLYDMGGNVWEWCQDYYSESFYSTGKTNPVNTTAGTNSIRVRRGGSWNYHSSTLLTYSRASDFQNRGNNHFGFRVVKN